MPLDLKEHIKHLSGLAAPAGYESAACDAIREVWAGLADTVQVDSLGNLMATKTGSGPEPRRKIMLCAHMDEIGLIVAEIRDGFIRAIELGGIDARVLLSQPVVVHGQRALPGVFGAAPPHMARSRSEYPTLEDLWIDVGLPHEDVTALVSIGDVITFDAPAIELKGDRLAGKSFDNRVSVAAITVCLEELATRQHAWDVVAVASVQEEVGSHGAIAAAYSIQPDIAIAIDGTFAAQAGANDDETFKLGDGPTLARGPNFHPLLFKHAREVAQAEEFKHQIEVLHAHSGTDAWLIQVSREGVPSLLLSIPMRNMHTPVEVIDVRDVRRTGRWMAALIAGLGPDFLDEIAWPEAPQKEGEA